MIAFMSMYTHLVFIVLLFTSAVVN